jgi:RecB family exonuclease
MTFEDNPAFRLAAQDLRIRTPRKPDQPHHRGVTDLITFHTCPRHAHFFSEGRYPTNTPPAVLGRLLHRTIRNLHGRYRDAQDRGHTDWIPNEEAVLEECQIAEEAARMQGLPQLFPEQREQLRRMLRTFHAIEAHWFYPRIKAAEVSLSWLWEEAPGGPVLLEGKVDVVFLQDEHTASGIALWDYKTGKQPQLGSPELRSYRQQMKLYAFLYRQCFKESPQETALYFMQELAGKVSPTSRPSKALYQVPVTDEDDEDVLEWLGDVLTQEQECEENNEWNPPPPGEVPERMCRNCGVHWSCPSFKESFPWESGGSQEDPLEPFDL